MKDFVRVLKWTFNNDFAEPFPELLVFLFVFVVATSNFIDVGGTDQLFANLTWKVIVVLIIMVGIGGTRSYSQALERGEIGLEMLSLKISRIRFALLKYLAVFLIFAGILFVADVVAFFEFLGYFPSVQNYSMWGFAPTATFAIMFLEQLLLLFFLNSLIFLLALTAKRPTVVLLGFFVFAIFFAMPSMFTQLTIPKFLAIGYGDYEIVNQLSGFVFVLLYRNTTSQIAIFAPKTDAVLSLIYRGCVGAVTLIAALQVFKRVNMD
jgi:ABC-type transport system involved in multi-copper enzyme maturation permease subunit